MHDEVSKSLGWLLDVAANGSGTKQVNDASLSRFRQFFRFPLTKQENEQELWAWRAMSERERSMHEHNARWGIGYVLHMLELDMREWQLGRISTQGLGTVLIVLTNDEMRASTGVMRQIVEYAGGRVVEEDMLDEEMDRPSRGP